MRPQRSPVTPSDVRDLARRLLDRDAKRWAAMPAAREQARLDVPLHPPTEVQALADPHAGPAWADSWRAPDFDVDITWEQRRWASLGTQRVPVRAVVQGADSIAEAAREGKPWAILRRRSDALLQGLSSADGGASHERVAAAITSEAGRLADLTDDDFDRLVAVVTWLDANRYSGHYVRQLPVRGIDTKWIAGHRRLVVRFVTAVTGSGSLGLTEAPSLIRVRFLDPLLAPGGLADIAAPAAALAELDIAPATVFVFENLESVVAMPPVSGGVVVHGSGYAVDRLGDIPWVRSGRVVYWGDLDSHGFAILHQARGSCDDVTSVLMDAPTLEAHRDLVGHEPQPTRGTFDRLTLDESAMLETLRRGGDLRLEQERIEWEYALSRLRAAALAQ